jgi:ABC-type phosphate transport system permease subunit
MVGVRANKAHRDERIALGFLMTSSAIFVLAIALILGLFGSSTGRSCSTPTTFRRSRFCSVPIGTASAGKFGAAPFIVGSLVATGFAILVGGPLGVAIGLFFSELAPKRVAAPSNPRSKCSSAFPRSCTAGSD